MPDIKSRRITLVSKEDYRVDLEYNKDFAIIHLPVVEKFNRNVYLDMRNTLEDISEFTETAGFQHLWAAIGEEDKKMAKFIKKLGFVYKGNDQNLDVYLYEGSI